MCVCSGAGEAAAYGGAEEVKRVCMRVCLQ